MRDPRLTTSSEAQEAVIGRRQADEDTLLSLMQLTKVSGFNQLTVSSTSYLACCLEVTARREGAKTGGRGLRVGGKGGGVNCKVVAQGELYCHSNAERAAARQVDTDRANIVRAIVKRLSSDHTPAEKRS